MICKLNQKTKEMVDFLRTEHSKKGIFRRSVMVLVGGTAFGHIITALALPVATRLYSPADFSALAVFASVVSIVSVAACLRFDIAIPVSTSDDEAANLLVLSLAFALCISLIVGVTVAILPEKLIDQWGFAAINSYLWLLPFGIFFAATYSALQGWFVRKSGFGLIARCRVIQSSSMAAGQIGFGISGVTPLGLLIGHSLNTAFGCLVLGRQVLLEASNLFAHINRASLYSVFYKFSRFPKFSTLEALCNNAAIQLPVIMIAAFSIGPEAGFLTLAMTVMQAPLALIGNAIGQVYLSRAPEEYRNGTLSQFTVDTLGRLSQIGIGPLVFAAITAPEMFSIVFGENWRRAGVILAWLTPWFVMQFLASPLSMVIHVTGHQRAAMVLQIFGLVVRVAPVWGCIFFGGAFIVEAYALSGLVFYFVYSMAILLVVEATFSAVKKSLAKCLLPAFAWSALGVVFLWLASEINMKNLISL